MKSRTDIRNLKRCPNRRCKSDELTIEATPLRHWWVRCKVCFLEGPTGQSEKEGCAFWNELPRDDEVTVEGRSHE